MKKNEIEVGGHYVAKVNGLLRTVRVDSIRESGSYGGRKSVTVYDVTNLATGRTTLFRSASKFRSVATDPKQMTRLERGIRQLSNEAHRGVITKEQHDAAFDALLKKEKELRQAEQAADVAAAAEAGCPVL